MKKLIPVSRSIVSAHPTDPRDIRRFNHRRVTLRFGLLSLLLFNGIGATQAQTPDPLTITKEGNVGIGTPTPGNKLSVAGNADFSGKVSVGSNADFSGKVGIGTVTPVSKLHIHGDYLNTGAGGFALDANDGSNSEQYVLRINPFALGNSMVGYQFQTKSSVGGTQVPLTFDNEGRVGIGTTKPISGLSISSVKAKANTPDQVIGQLTFVGFDRSVASASILAQSPGWDDASHMIFKTSKGGDGAQERMRITSEGNVGIGATNPTRGKVEIVGSSNLYRMPLMMMLRPDGRNTPLMPGQGQTDISLYADGAIAAPIFYAFSDERIKRLEGRSDAARDLSTLMGIEITDYHYKDVIRKGDGAHKKVAGQQVEKVFPQAVIKTTDVVPDIYLKATTRDGWIMLATNLKKGERVRLIGEKQEGIHEVLQVGEGRFRTAFAADGSDVFVYGREVNDARRVDYEAISMLNVSATQELARRLEKLEKREAHAATLEQKNVEVKALQEENTALRSRLAEQEKRLAAIETLLLSAGKPTAVTASLKKVN